MENSKHNCRSFLSALAAVVWMTVPSIGAATVIDFEDAYNALGYTGNPVSFYQASDGVRFEGNNFGLLADVSNGDPGNFNLEGTNGPASLSVNTINHVIDMVFDSAFSSLVLDLGISNGLTSEITIDTYIGNVLQDSNVINLTDGLNNGLGDWHELDWSNRDRVKLTASGGWRAWAIDNLRIDEQQQVPEPTTLALLGLGLAGIGFRRRKIR